MGRAGAVGGGRSSSWRNLFSSLSSPPPPPPPRAPPSPLREQGGYGVPYQHDDGGRENHHHNNNSNNNGGAGSYRRSGSCRLPHPSPREYDEQEAPRYSTSLLLGGRDGGYGSDDDDDDVDDDYDGFGLLPSEGGNAGRREQDNLVDFVHHSSPVGPAVSVYPKGFQQQQVQKNNNSSSGHHPPSSPTRRHHHHLQQQQVNRNGHSDGFPANSSAFSSTQPPPSPRKPPPPSSYHGPDTRKPPPRSYSNGLDQRRTPPPPQGDLDKRGAGLSSSSYHPGETSPRSIMVEIFPGVHAKLRGADETRECVRTDFFIPCTCMSCSMEMFCIQDASYVLCPQCRVVNALSACRRYEGESLEINSNHSRDDFFEDKKHNNHHNNHRNNHHNHRNKRDEGGLGLGFSLEDLRAIQRECKTNRRTRVSRLHY